MHVKIVIQLGFSIGGCRLHHAWQKIDVENLPAFQGLSHEGMKRLHVTEQLAPEITTMCPAIKIILMHLRLGRCISHHQTRTVVSCQKLKSGNKFSLPGLIMRKFKPVYQ